jgi:hypothetical protein
MSLKVVLMSLFLQAKLLDSTKEMGLITQSELEDLTKLTSPE